VNAPTTVADLLERQAGRRPDRPAVIAGDGGALTYRELQNRVAAIAGELRELGYGPGDRLAVIRPNGADLAVTLLAVLTVATAVPMADDHPPEQLERYLRGSRARAVLVDEAAGRAGAAAAHALGLPVIATVDAAPAGAAQVEPASRGGDDALVLHTSGTTGRPKYVCLSHSRLCHSAANIAAGLELTEDDRCLNVMPLSHAHGLLTPLLATLTAGGSVVCLAGFDVDAFYAALAGQRPTWYSAVPAIHQEILGHAGRHDAAVAAAALRFVRSASASLPTDVLHRLEQTFRAPVIEAYGMTETTSVVASNPLPPRPRRPGSVGLPVGCEITIVGPDGRPVDAGQVGEVAVRGPTVVDAYDPAADPDDDRDVNVFADGWLRTGDLGRLDKDGYLYLAGRTKEIINRGGLTVSPYEIDVVLRAHPAIAEAVAFGVPHPSLGEDVAVAVVAVPGADLTEHEVRRYAAGHLGLTLMPSRVVIVDEIPHGPTGKVERLRLHERLPTPPVEFAAPGTELQATLVAIWREVLGRERVGVHDNFFDLGGDSLRALRVCDAVTQRTGFSVSVVDLFAFSTIAALAESMQTRDAGRVAGPDGDTVRAGRARLSRRRDTQVRP
jgi:acyl-CoA synthetase (AMP-forming)/AMP-acid ligase II